MRATTRFLLLGAFAMCLSACLPQPPMGSEAAIFKRPSRYGWGASGRRPGQGAQPEQKKQQQRSPSNRFGHTDNQRKPNNSGSNSSQSSNPSSNSGSSSTSDSGSSSLDPPAPISDNDGGGDNNKKMTDSGSSSSSSDSGGSSNSGGNSSAPSTPPSNLNAYPYARLVPGKKGYVTLPGANAGVGEIDVTGIKPGTPVEINDPRDPSKKIYFRVP